MSGSGACMSGGIGSAGRRSGGGVSGVLSQGGFGGLGDGGGFGGAVLLHSIDAGGDDGVAADEPWLILVNLPIKGVVEAIAVFALVTDLEDAVDALGFVGAPGADPSVGTGDVEDPLGDSGPISGVVVGD